MKVIAKFRCDSIEPQGKDGEISMFRVKLSVVCCGSEENKNFFSFTPAGDINMSIVNEETAKQFEIDKEYYITFSDSK